MSQLDLLIFVVGALGRVSVKLIGDLYVSDIFLALLVVARWRSAQQLLRRGILRRIFILGCLWLFAQILTDLYWETPFEDWSRGWAKIAFFFADLLGLSLLTRFRMRSALVLMFGFSFSFLLQSLFFPNDGQAGGEFADGMWKFGVGPFFNGAAACLCASRLLFRMIGKPAEYLPLLIIGFVDLALNSRSGFGIAVAAALTTIFAQFLKRHPLMAAKITPASFVAVLILAAGVGRGIVGIYEFAAENDWLSESAKAKYIQQSMGSRGLLLSGRGESIASVEAILDSPIIGHGSWAKDEKYLVTLFNALADEGTAKYSDIYNVDDFTIPTHSHILGAWVEAGVFGAVFWAFCAALIPYAAYITLKRINTPLLAACYLGYDTNYIAFIYYSLIGFAWIIPFSGFANSSRIADSATLIVILSSLSTKRALPKNSEN
jgi:O-antigen ligase